MHNPVVYVGIFAVASMLSLVILLRAGKRAIDKAPAGSPIGPIVALVITVVAIVCQVLNHFWFHAFALVVLGIGNAICTWLAWEE